MIKIIFGLIFLSQILHSQSFNQEVNYKIDAELLPDSKILKVNSLIDYKNNSPDELKEIFLHIYWNIYSANSYARKLAELQKDYYSQQTTDVVIKKVLLKQNENNIENTFELDNTVMRIPLIQPLKTGQSLKIEIELEEEIPPEGLRMGYHKRYFSIAHWFPSVCVYDKFGWHKDQYLGTGEFFEEISNFEINLTLPETYLVFHTGDLINPEEVYNESILRNLEVAKKSDTTVRIFTPTYKIQINDEKKKTWKFKANNVRTFAFACFEDYLWDASNQDGILVHTVYPEILENFYKNEGMKAAKHAIKFFSEKIGPYIYSQMFVTVGGSSGGMEYPGIVFMGRGQIGGILSYNTASVIIHEIGHNWFPMMLNSNEVDYAFMDEGFNTFFTTLATEELYGKEKNRFKLEGFLSKLFNNSNVRTGDYSEVIQYLQSGYTEPIMTHSDRYEQTLAYVVNSYPRTSMNLFMLQYIMGEKAFDELWQEYYKRFLLKKIYPEDFFNLAEEIYQKHNGRKSLRWFFDQWFYKDYTLDLVIKEFNVKEKEGKFQTTISVSNNGRALMPCDVEIEFDDGSKESIFFDVEEFSKGVQVATKTLTFNKKPVQAEINPDKRLLDVNRLNNTSKILPPIKLVSKPIINLVNEPFYYNIFYSPYLWFNNYDGLKFGFKFEGKYNVDQRQFDLSLFKGLRRGINSFGGDFNIKDKLNFLGPLAYGSFRFFNYEGRRGIQLKINKTFARSSGRNPQFYVSFSANYFDAFDDTYFDKNKFDIGKIMNFTNGSYFLKNIVQRKFLYSINQFSYVNNWEFFKTKFDVYYEAGIVKENENIFYNTSQNSHRISVSNQNVLYQKLSFSFVQDFKPNILLTSLRFRQFVGVTPKKLPKAKEFYIASVNPVDEFNLLLYRTYGIFSRNFISSHSVPNGDGFMRGYFRDNISDDLITTFNGEINFARTFSYFGVPGKIFSVLNPKFFFDIGNVWANEKEIKLKALKADWGISLSLVPEFDGRIATELNKINPFSDLGINDLRIDFPLFVSHPPQGENRFQFRWLLGLRTVF